jgi:hypothetical protein
MAQLVASGFAIDAHGKAEFSISKRPEGDIDIFCSKEPSDILVVRPLLRIDPDLWVIYMLRDPRDVIVSQHKMAPDKYWTNLRIWKEFHRAAKRIWDHPRFIVVRYESLVSDPNATQDMLARRMAFLTRTNSFSLFHEFGEPSRGAKRAMGGIRPVTDDSVGRWRDHKPRVAAQLALHGSISQELLDLGYEGDETWLDELATVVPDEDPSYLPEHPSLQDRAFRYARLVKCVLTYWLGIVPSTSRNVVST